MTFNKYLKNAVLTLSALICLAHFAVAQGPALGLLADDMTYDPAEGLLIAKGNVRIVSDGRVLTTNQVIYNERTNKLILPNGFAIVDQAGTVVRGENSVLTQDFTNSIIKGARVLIANRLQIAADQGQYKDNRFKVFDRVVASTCYICKDDPIPFWQIRANRVIHDEVEKQLYFEHARLEFVGLPIFYAPLLRLPDPTVERATGFLVPSFFTSDLLKFGAKIPYFIAINDHSDATATAYVASVGSIVGQVQYRRKTQNGGYQFDGALLLRDGIDHNPFRSYLKGSGAFNLRNDYSWGFDVDLTSDDTFRAQYGYEDEDAISAQDRLLSQVYLQRSRQNSYFKLSASSIQSLRTTEIDAEIPLVFPEVYWRSLYRDPLFDGKLGLTAHTTTLLRTNSSRFSRFGFSADWQKSWQSRQGLLFGLRGAVDGELYSMSNYTGFTGNSASRITPTVSADLRLPLSKVIGGTTHVIEPIVQLVWSDDSLNGTPNEDSVQVEFEETNLFSENRFPGFDQKELGLRANVGVTYTRYDPKGWTFSATAGRVYRDKSYGQFSSASGLSGKQSDWVGAVSLSFPNQFTLTNRILFSSDFHLSKNETNLAFSYQKLTGKATYLWLEKDVVAGASDPRREAALELIYTPNDNWSYLAEWRHNFVTNRATEGEFGVKYENECVEVNLSLSLQYTASGSVSPTKELGLTVALVGFGNNKKTRQRRHRCGF